jgi:hypothetical protein
MMMFMMISSFKQGTASADLIANRATIASINFVFSFFQGLIRKG